MLTRSQIKDIQALQRKKYRVQRRQYVVEGPKIVHEAIPYCPERIKIYATASWVEKEEDILQKYGPVVEIITEKELSKISQLKTPNEVLAVIDKAEKESSFKWNNMALFLENIQDPGNMGTIIRSADWFGVQTIICSEDCVELYNPKVLQSAMGSHFRIDFITVSLADFLEKNKLPVYGATLNGENFHTVEFPKTFILAIGNESKGLSLGLKNHCQKEIAIPKKGKAESLNAAMATGILLSHLAD